jgi:hypothetical protein
MCLISFVLVLALATTSAGQDIAEGLVGYWPLDEGGGTTTADASGNGNDGTLNAPTWDTGKFGGALSFDGSDDFVDLGNPPILDFGTGDFTISAWVKTTSPAGETVFGNGGDNSGGIRLRLYVDGSTGELLLDDNNDKYDPGADIPVTDGQWHHLVGLRRGTNLRLYVDGVEDPGVTSHSESTIPANYDLSGTSQHPAYIGCVTNNESGQRSKFFGGLIDDVALWSRALSVEEIGSLWNGGAGNPVEVAPAGQASDPIPDDGQDDVPRHVVLTWTPGEFAAAINGHTVFLSESFNDVNDGIGGVTQSDGSYAPEPRLDLGTTYYWRIDEVNGAPDFAVHPGEVWSFETEPVGFPMANVTATASSSAASQGPVNATVDGSGLTDDLHSKDTPDMWVSEFGAAQPTWIQFEFDEVEMLHEMLVWNSNTELEGSVGFGFKDVTIEHSLDGVDYATLGTTHEFARAPGVDGYAHNTTVDFGGLQAKHVRLTANSNWGGFLPQFGLSEVRFLHIPARARKPQPESGAADVPVDLTLAWRTGRLAAEHNVYVSADEQAVIDGTAPVAVVTEAGFSPPSLELDSTYYWRVDEVNDAETPTTWQGDILNFLTQEYLVVDGFETYNDIPAGEPGSNLVYVAWVDGFDNPNANGSTMGYVTGESLETGKVHGGDKSVPFEYNNTTAGISEVVRTFTPAQDWTDHGVITLSLWFYGDPANTSGQLYVKINGVKVPYDGPAGNLALPGWQVWNIDLASVGTNLQSVTSLAIGVEGAGATGTLLLDDIGLYRSAPVPPNEWRIADSADDAEEHGDWDAGAMEDLTSGDMEMPYEDTGMGEIQTIGLRFTGIPIPRGATITEAWVQFQVDDPKDGTQPVNLIIEGELSVNSATFSDNVHDISGRPTTTAQVQWSVPNWVTVGDHGPDQATPSIASIIQEIVNQPGWSGGAIVLMFRDDPASPSLGIRSAVSFDGDPLAAALLHISYQ